MIHIALLICMLFPQKEEIPFKAREDFEIKLDMAFKQRTNGGAKTLVFNEDVIEKRSTEGLLPTLKLKVKILNVQENEIKVKVVKDDATTVLSKKVTKGMEFTLDLGFTDDLKDRIEGYKHVIQFFSPKKKVVSKIVIEFDEEGNYYVNGERMGKV